MMLNPTNKRLFTVAVGVLALVAVVSPARSDHKAGPPSREDLDRVEKKIDEQQKVIDKLVAAHQQYVLFLTNFFDFSVSPMAASTKPVFDAKTEVDADAKPDVKPIATRVIDTRSKGKKEWRKEIAGTVVGKVAGATGTVVGKVAGASDAVIYVENISGPSSVPAGAPVAIMDQKDKQFQPPVLVVQRGTTVQFPNLDAVFHNVFSVSPDLTFDLGSYRQGDSRSVVMARAGIVNVYCNMHPQMVGYILVVPNAHYVQTGKDGFFRLTDVPTGRRRVIAWAPNAKLVATEVDVIDNQAVTVEITVKKGRSEAHTKKNGLSYGSYEQ